MDKDIKDVAKRLIQGSEERKKRIQYHKASSFDIQADKAITDALTSLCEDIQSPIIKKQMQDNIYKSIVHSIPYEYMDICCGRRQFYNYRNKLIMSVANNMGMVLSEPKQNNNTKHNIKANMAAVAKAGQN